MDLMQIIILAIVQGLTEFLPISSSAHLILVPLVVKWPDQGLAFDVAVHVGSLLAVLTYFRHTVKSLITAWFGSLTGGRVSSMTPVQARTRVRPQGVEQQSTGMVGHIRHHSGRDRRLPVQGHH